MTFRAYYSRLTVSGLAENFNADCLVGSLLPVLLHG